MKRVRLTQAGFALPTVVITSVVLFAILVAAVGTITSVRTSLDTQYYESIAADAAESGATMADSCIKDAGGSGTWTSPLTPATNCNGATGQPDSGTSAYTVTTPTFNATFTVGTVTNGAAGTQTATVTGTVNLVRASTGQSWKKYTKTLYVKTGGQVSTSQVIFGYSTSGAYFATVSGNGAMYATGYNGWGQLGNGTYAPSLTPRKFLAPTTNQIVAGYASFLSGGWHMFAIDSAGYAYAAGYNKDGQLGVGTTASYAPTPMRVVLPPGVQVKYIAVSGKRAYFLGSDNNIYAAGSCAAGALGNSYTISGCSDQVTPVRVALPTPTSDPNTIPTANITTDRDTTYVRMAGGRVYGWGANDLGQLGDISFVDKSTPVQIGTYGAGGLVATKVLTDGVTGYILDNNGKLNALGVNEFGEMGTGAMMFKTRGTNMCLDNKGGDGVTVQVYTCNGSAAQRFEYRSDKTVYNASANVCLQTPDAGATLNLAACDGSAKQKFTWQPTNEFGFSHLVNVSVNECVDNGSYNVSGTSYNLNACNGYANQLLYGLTSWLAPFNMAGISGTIMDVATDQWSVSVLTTNGEVWSAGVNTSGQFGNGTQSNYQPFPVKFNMPVKAKYIYETNVSLTDQYQYQNLFAIGVNGKVYGAGSNKYGQLGTGSTANVVTTPVVMSVIDGTSIAAGSIQVGLGTTVVFAANGAVYTVGNNGNGQLGDGTTNNSSIPIRAKYVNDLKTLTY